MTATCAACRPVNAPGWNKPSANVNVTKPSSAPAGKPNTATTAAQLSPTATARLSGL